MFEVIVSPARWLWSYLPPTTYSQWAWLFLLQIVVLHDMSTAIYPPSTAQSVYLAWTVAATLTSVSAECHMMAQWIGGLKQESRNDEDSMM
jgi:hypothetical protein